VGSTRWAGVRFWLRSGQLCADSGMLLVPNPEPFVPGSRIFGPAERVSLAGPFGFVLERLLLIN